MFQNSTKIVLNEIRAMKISNASNLFLSLFYRSAERFVRVKWRDLRVGDLVHLSNNEAVPADMVLLQSSNPLAICYLDTCNLDGETNLKQRIVAPGFKDKV